MEKIKDDKQKNIINLTSNIVRYIYAADEKAGSKEKGAQKVAEQKGRL